MKLCLKTECLKIEWLQILYLVKFVNGEEVAKDARKDLSLSSACPRFLRQSPPWIKIKVALS